MHISFATASFKSPRHRFQLYPLSSHHCIHLTHPLPCPSLITVGFDCIQILLLGQRRMHRGGICCTPHLSGGGGAASIPDVMDQVSEAINNNDGANPFWGIQLSRATGLWLSLQRIFLTCFDFFFPLSCQCPGLGVLLQLFLLLVHAYLNFQDQRDGIRDQNTRSAIPTRFSETADLNPSRPDSGVKWSSLGLQVEGCKHPPFLDLLSSKEV